MNNYYVHYWSNFGNTYRLYYAPAGEPVPDEWERITRKDAIKLCTDERYRRRTDPAFSGYADEYIFPAFCGRLRSNQYTQITREFSGYIVPAKCITVFEY